MRFFIETNLPDFWNDIGDVIRIFFGEGAVVSDSSGATVLTHVHCQEEDEQVETVSLSYEGKPYSWSLRETIPNTDAVEFKRRIKRLIKRCAYHVLKEVSGYMPPWGSLTGIRPTRLYYQQLSQGLTEPEADRMFADEFDVSDSRIELIKEVIHSQSPYLAAEDSEYDIYIGIPFCKTRCSFCSFSSGTIGNGKRVEPYLNALMHEIEESAKLLAENQKRVRTIYIGGGTPTSISASQLERLLSGTLHAFGNVTEWTVEAGRPDTIDREKLAVMRDYPVSRISINPQSMNDETLIRIGRNHSAEEIRTTYELARSLGFDNINMDIIVGLPGENLEMFLNTLSCIREMRPESLTVHTLAIKHASKLHEAQYVHDWDVMYLKMADLGHACAHELGMKAYYLYRQKYMASNLENVGYAVPEKICIYNIDNMEETTNVLALGAGGISKRIFGANLRIERAPNVSDIDTYIACVDEMIERKRALIATQRAKEG